MKQTTFNFCKEENSLWYIELPTYPGSKGDLQMVAGADTFLDMLNEGSNIVTLDLATSPFEGCEELWLWNYNPENLDLGATYLLSNFEGTEINHQMWLCPVTLFVFNGEYPETIYFRKIRG